MGPTTERLQTRSHPTMPGDSTWDDLRRELDAWAERGRIASFWWRDDDAIEPTPALDRLLDLAARHGAPLALAVIPAAAQPALFTRLQQAPDVTLLLHGYAHRNHAPAGAKKAELGAHRPPRAMLDELARGWAMLSAAAGGRALPVLVPPWNRIDPALVELLPGIGIAGLSTAKPRATRSPTAGLVQANTHVDPVDWPGRRAGGSSFAGTAAGLAAVLRHLRARRGGDADPTEPTGLLTHHLVMDEAGWAFADRLLATTRGHRAARWIDATRVFAADAGACP